MVVQGRDYPWPDPTTITFREAQIIKKRLGFSLMGLFHNMAEGVFDEEALLGMYVLAKLRTDGDFDIDQVLALSLADIQIEDDSEEEPEAEEDASPLAEEPGENEPEAVEPEPKPKRQKSASSSA